MTTPRRPTSLGPAVNRRAPHRGCRWWRRLAPSASPHSGLLLGASWARGGRTVPPLRIVSLQVFRSKIAQMPQSAREVDRFLELPYHIVLVRDESGGEEESWTARVEELPGCEARDKTPD